MQRFIKDANYGPQQEKLPIDFNPAEYDNPEDAAKAFFEALKPVVEMYGQDPEIECGLRSPAESEGNGWQVWWEAGPWEWGIVASLEWLHNIKAGWFTEPYYSFDVCFVE